MEMASGTRVHNLAYQPRNVRGQFAPSGKGGVSRRHGASAPYSRGGVGSE
jgi:hypothetical protein